MSKSPTLFHRLFPAALATSLFAGVAHAIAVAIAARSVGLELLYIATLTFMIALVVAFIGGAVLLAIVSLLRLTPLPALILFVIAIQAVAIGLEMTIFEIGLKEISWQYGLITIPAAVIAWYQSVYLAHQTASRRQT